MEERERMRTSLQRQSMKCQKNIDIEGDICKACVTGLENSLAKHLGTNTSVDLELANISLELMSFLNYKKIFCLYFHLRTRFFLKIDFQIT